VSAVVDGAFVYGSGVIATHTVRSEGDNVRATGAWAVGMLAATAAPTTGGTEPHRSNQEEHMLYWTAVFFAIALGAAVLGFTGIAGAAAGVAKILFVVFLIVAVLSLLFRGRVPA
jgi:uncharacterized membrane protein YtjA (UPF0391 family)